MKERASHVDARLLTPEFWTLAGCASLFYLGMGAANALLPKFVVDELAGTEATAGFVMGSMAISALATRMWFGRVADRHGARRILVMGALLGALSMLALAVVDSVSGAVLTRLLAGAGGAAFITGSTMLSIELAPPDRRSQAASFILISFHVGMGIGPAAAEALLRRSSYTVVWTIVAAVVAGSALVAMRLTHRPGHDATEGSPWIHRSALGPGAITLFGVFAFNGFLMFVPLYAREVGMADAGLAFAISSVTIVVVRLLFGRVPDIVGPIPAGTFALTFTVFSAAVVAMWATPAGVLLGAALLATGLALQSPSFIALAVDGVSARERGSAMATFTAFYDIANALIGPTMGLLVSRYGYREAFLAAGFMSLLGLALLHLVVAPRRRPRLTDT